MSHVNSWLLVLSFLLGLVLTLAFMIRRVKREVPIYDSAKFTSTAGAKPKPESASATTEPKTEAFARPTVDEPKTEAFARPTVDESKTEVIRRPTVDEPKTEVISRPTIAGAAGAAGLVGGAALAGSGEGSHEDAGEEPYGAGSFRLVGGASAPSGWTIKGNEDSMLYHSPESAAYNVTVAEIWFRDVPTAEAAGFNRWDSGKSQREK